MAETISPAQLRAIAGGKAPFAAKIAESFNPLAAAFGLTTPLRQAHFFAQLAHESAGYKYVREIWGPTAAQSRYESRKDLGNTQPGDGSRFRGRGLIQVTGRANARELTEWIRGRYPDAPDFEADPEALEQFPWALVGAFWYWETRKLNALADRDDVVGITKKINGGTNGLADRRAALKRAKVALGVTPATRSAPIAKPKTVRVAEPPVAPLPTPAAATAKPSRFTAFLNLLRGRPALPPVTEPPAATNPGDPTIFSVQTQLLAKGYPGVRRADGLMGPRTRDAILLIQQHNGMKPTGEITPEFLAALPGLPARVFSTDQTTAGKAELKQQAPDVAKPLGGLGGAGWLTIAFSSLGGIKESGVLDSAKITADQATQTLQSVQSIVDTGVTVIQWVTAHWWLLGLGLGVFILARVGMAVLKLIVLLRQGRLL